MTHYFIRGTTCKVGIMRGSKSKIIIANEIIDTISPKETVEKIL